MSVKDLIGGRFQDDDTYRLMEITCHFLGEYFGYSSGQIESLVGGFFEAFGSRFDEDVIHHELPYRMAAVIHYLQGMKVDPQELGNWLSENHNRAPAEAME